MSDVQYTKRQLEHVAWLQDHGLPAPSTGDVWDIGPHRIVVGSMEVDGVVAALLEHGPWEVCWTDPPWNQGIGRTFRRQAGEDAVEPDLPLLFENLAMVLTQVVLWASSWTGREAEDLSRGALIAAGFGDLSAAAVTYAGVTTPTPVWVGSKTPILAAYSISRNMHGTTRGVDQVAAMLKALPQVEGGYRMVDPFCGQEVAAYAARHAKVSSLTGAEIHRGRAAATIRQLMDRGALVDDTTVSSW